MQAIQKLLSSLRVFPAALIVSGRPECWNCIRTNKISTSASGYASAIQELIPAKSSKCSGREIFWRTISLIYDLSGRFIIYIISNLFNPKKANIFFIIMDNHGDSYCLSSFVWLKWINYFEYYLLQICLKMSLMTIPSKSYHGNFEGIVILFWMKMGIRMSNSAMLPLVVLRHMKRSFQIYIISRPNKLDMHRGRNQNTHLYAHISAWMADIWKTIALSSS